MLRRIIKPVILTAAVVITVTIETPAMAAPAPANFGTTAPRTSITFTHTPTGNTVGTPNEHESRPGLSIVKLYIADYVYDHGTDADKADAFRMLQVSDDGIASALYERYPDSIDSTSRKYGLHDTHAAPHWGYSTTSTYDSTRYLEARKRDHGVADPILTALATAAPVAADGYRQDYGTSHLPGVIGTKWGWSDDRSTIHATASYGTDFSVSAHTYGPAAQLTGDVLGAFAGGYGTLPGPSPANQAITDAAHGAHATVNGIAGAISTVPGSSDAAAHSAAQAHQAIESATDQARRMAERFAG
ncbi:hypothetical protein G7Y29_10500 [Corynebacterium qintianiae]|uniref:Serine hydrolase n=1 Tax=Corynebacterium qintianiae TaxID=2709392 RepID=A0A7T0PFQ5_9CORY|nr:hypothetical protein [Corynebacterium qintianiae]QPK83232.1 hypothetical protein G7Y29_10500 [Corynebacterium qintianiae]